MFTQFIALILVNLKALLRDRILHAIFAVSFVILLLVPTLSTFSMRQVQELSITLTLSATSMALLVSALLLGASAIWRDIERRYTASVLPLPITRSCYLLSKFSSCVIFLLLCALVLGIASAVVIYLSSLQYPSTVPICWLNIFLAITFDVLKYILLAAIAVTLSAVSTSFALPFFGTLAIYFAGSAAQEVFEYISGQYGEQISPLALSAIKAVYYILPNFAGYDFKVHAVYALPITLDAVLFPVFYSVFYVSIVLGLGVWLLNRRQLP